MYLSVFFFFFEGGGEGGGCQQIQDSGSKNGRHFEIVTQYLRHITAQGNIFGLIIY